jgi:hypothetical protein
MAQPNQIELIGRENPLACTSIVGRQAEARTRVGADFRAFFLPNNCNQPLQLSGNFYMKLATDLCQFRAFFTQNRQRTFAN